MANPKKANENEITIIQINQGELRVCIKGDSPLICEAMSYKSKGELLFPRGRLNDAEKASRMKHVPVEEYRASTYRSDDSKSKTRIIFPSAAFKKAAASSAIDIPGAAKAQIGRLLWAVGDYVEIFGVPKLLMSVVRSSDMARTPDIRTRAILPEWACSITFRFMSPMLKEATVVNLLAAGGVIRGVGGWRQEKGSGSYGQFSIVSPDDPDFARICQTGGREAQDAALASPQCYDHETEQLFAWYNDEVAKRGPDAAKSVKNGKKKADVVPEVVA